MIAESNSEKALAIARLPQELGINEVSESHFKEIEKAIQTAPPVKFDVVRQVRVFEPYLQYVELKLSGAAIQKHKVGIPPAICCWMLITLWVFVTFSQSNTGFGISCPELSNTVEIRWTRSPSRGRCQSLIGGVMMFWAITW